MVELANTPTTKAESALSTGKVAANPPSLLREGPDIRLAKASEVTRDVPAGMSTGREGVGGGSLVAKSPLSVPAAGEDLFVGLYGQTRRANIQSGLNATHTPHHVVQNAVSDTSHSLGVTINMRKDLHQLTRSYGRNADLGNNVSNLAADIWDLRTIFRGAGYDSSLVNQQMRALIDLNRKVGNVP
jgi:hypothetical protein